jgi:2-polyprenyl-6-methoxyphenol hydroxylase-like FAD-dependent oxidoreductase
MTFWVAGAVVVSSAIGANASSRAASTQAGAADRAAELQRQQFDRQVELQAPWREAGVRALGKLESASDYTPFSMNAFQADPGYGFRMSEGMKALERSAAARGGLMGGATGKALTRYGQDMGSQEYQNAFNRYQAERQARLGPLQSLAGVGQTATNALGQAGQNYATGAGEALGAGAQARASGYIGAANAMGGGLNQYMNYSQNQAQNSLLQQALARNSPSNPYTGTGGYGAGYTGDVPGYGVGY